MIIKNKNNLNSAITAGKYLREVLDTLRLAAVQGVSTKQLDEKAYKMIKDFNCKPIFLNYKPKGELIHFPASICTSINDEIIHGIPTEKDILKNGDVLKIDIGLSFEGVCVDSAFTMVVGNTNKSSNLLAATKEALERAINVAKPGNRIGQISSVIEETAKDYGMSIISALGGHGIGNELHEDPFIANEGQAESGEVLKENMMIAIEPIFSEGKSKNMKKTENNFSYRTVDGSNAAHFEHTILVADEPVILTGKMW